MTAPLPLMTESELRDFAGDRECGYGCLRTERGALPLREMNVEARVIATFAHTTLRQVFVNTLGVPLEATYIFPLPDRAAVTRFTLEVAGRVVDGVLEERMQARRTYDQAIASGKRASIAEEERPGVFTIRVGNLMPGEAAAVTLEMSGALPVADGEVTYRFPLVVAPRYMPGQLLGGEDVGDGVAHDTDAVPDASRISPPVLLPGMQSPVRLSLAVELDAAGLPLSQVRSSLHAAYADERGGRLVVRTTPGERLDRDFILRFHLGDDAAHTSARIALDGAMPLPRGRGVPGALFGAPGFTEDATFALTLLPPTLHVSQKPKDVVFVIDRSGSMQGWKMVAARRATARMIDALRAHDRFGVIAFDNVVSELHAGLVEASDRERYRASEWLAKIDARGGTEMAAPLARAADLLGGAAYGGVRLERDRVLVFVTDGQVGNEAQLMKLLGARLRGARVFALGIDQAVNAGFLNRLAALGGAGDAELVESEDRLDEVLQRVHRRVDAPVIAELSVDVEGAQLLPGTLSPAQLPDVFAGVPATVCGRVRLDNRGGRWPVFVVRGRTADGGRFEDRIYADPVTNPAVRTAWARLHLRDLEDRFDASMGNRAELERRIVEVSLANNVLCRFTAFVAVDGEVVNRGGWQHHATQPVEQPAGFGGGAPAGAPAPMPQASMPEASMGGRSRRSAAPSASRAESFDKAALARPPADLSRSAVLDEESNMDAPAPRAPSRVMAPPPPRAKPAGADLAKRKGGGFLGAMKDALGGKKEAAAGVSSFRARLEDLVQLARRKAQDLFGVARELEQRLRLLLEDMAHAGVPAHERRPLDEVERSLRDAVLSGDSLRVEQALVGAEDVLARAAGMTPSRGSVTPGGGKREGFWR